MQSEAKPEDIQEECYEYPYHWFINREDGNGFHYYGGVDLALRRLGDLKGKRVLDAGCGDGKVLSELVDRGCEVYGRDMSAKAVAFARLLVPEANVGICDLRSLDFQDSFFDSIILFSVLEHIPIADMQKVLAELSRVTKPGGRIAVMVPSSLVPVIPKHYKHFDRNDLAEILQPYFEVVTIIGHHRKSLVYSIAARIFDNSFWLIKPPLAWCYKRLVQECQPQLGVELLAIGRKG